MNYVEAWKPIAALIDGIRDAADLHSQFAQSHNANPYGVSKFLQERYMFLLDEVVKYKSSYRDVIPLQIIILIGKFEQNPGGDIANNSLGDELLGRANVVKIAAFGAEMAYLLTDNQAEILSRCELAFNHLQRLIVVDDTFRKKWSDAYGSGEVACERLGSVHLLWHGISAFKINAEGARTDLVFPEQFDAKLAGPSTRLVLTEWKLAQADIQNTYAVARKQAELYASGPLSGAELVGTRYAIVVSMTEIAVPSDVIESSVRWRHINICVNPSTPSVVAKKLG